MSLFQKLGSKKFYSIGLVLVVVLVFLLGWISRISYISDAEFWVTNLSAKGYSVWETNPSLIFKPIFHLVLMLPKVLGLNAEQFVLFNRLVFFVISIGTVFLTYALAHQLFKQKTLALLSSLLLLTSTSFFFYGHQIRSDALAIFFHLLAVLFWIKSNDNNKARCVAVALTAWLLMLLTTPKSVLLIVAAIPFIPLPWKMLVRKFGLKFFLSFALMLSGIFATLIFVEAYRNAGLYFIRGFLNGGAGAVEYMSLRSFIYLVRSLEQNWFFYFALVCSLIWPLYKSLNPPAKSVGLKAVYLHSLVSLSFLVFLPDKLPFYIASLIPIFSIQVVVFLRDASPIFRSKLKPVVATLVVIGCTLQVISFTERLNHTKTLNNNFQQKEFISELASFLSKNPKANYFDGMGILPTDQFYFQYLGYGQSDLNQMVMKEVLAAQPSILLQTGRMMWMRYMMEQSLNKEYINLGSGVWLKGFRFKKISEVTKDLNQDQLYSVCLNYYDSPAIESFVALNKVDITTNRHAKCFSGFNDKSISSLVLPKFSGYFYLVKGDISFPVPRRDLAYLFGFEIN